VVNGISANLNRLADLRDTMTTGLPAGRQRLVVLMLRKLPATRDHARSDLDAYA
jgi:hypothetical protein